MLIDCFKDYFVLFPLQCVDNSFSTQVKESCFIYGAKVAGVPENICLKLA